MSSLCERLDRARFDLSFAPSVELVSFVRRAVIAFYERVLDDLDATSRLEVATHELLENAVKYSADGLTSLHIDVARDHVNALVSVVTENRATDENIAVLRRMFDDFGKCPDAISHYRALMLATAEHQDGSQLGLGRVRAEAEMSLRYEFDGSTVRVHAQARIQGEAP